MIAISTKQLRTNFPSVIEQLKKGVSFMLIHKSVPVAEIRKPQTIHNFEEATDKNIEESSMVDVSDDFLSKEELNYYLSLNEKR